VSLSLLASSSEICSDALSNAHRVCARKFYMHGTSHWLGMDVHDAGAYTRDGKARPLEPNMVITVEPGLYVATDAENVPAELRGLGIRIEDDVLVTADGHEVLTAACPKTIEDVEAACRR
jgi:Xaa-Pro aminopeptidase